MSDLTIGYVIIALGMLFVVASLFVPPNDPPNDPGRWMGHE